MEIYGVGFAGCSVNIYYDSDQVAEFLDFLFIDLVSDQSAEGEAELTIRQKNDSETYVLSSENGILFTGYLGVQAAAILYDTVIFNILNNNNNGVALHAGAVSYQGRFIIVPGESGAGKSSFVAWLILRGLSYATDELVFFSNPDMDRVVSFSRPVCLKPDTVAAVTAEIAGSDNDLLADESGAIIPHRLMCANFIQRPQTPELLLFPAYQENAKPELDRLSGAQATARLMSCCANGRNLRAHGFKEIVTLARAVPAYQFTYGSFADIDKFFGELSMFFCN